MIDWCVFIYIFSTKNNHNFEVSKICRENAPILSLFAPFFVILQSTINRGFAQQTSVFAIKKPRWLDVVCDSARIRTWDPQLRRLLLYPAELRNRFALLSCDLKNYMYHQKRCKYSKYSCTGKLNLYRKSDPLLARHAQRKPGTPDEIE